MVESSDELERMSREQLILKARVLGVERAELMTRVEMRDEIVRRSEPDLAQQKRARGFLGVARDLVASVVEAGLNLPDAAAIIRGDGNRETDWRGPPPVATVTLAEIYAAQGHLDRALHMLDEVLAKEPDHDPARALRTRLATSTDLPVAPQRRRQRISFADASGTATDDVAAPAPAPEPAPATVSAAELVAEPVAAPVVASGAVSEPVAAPVVASEAVSESVVEPVMASALEAVSEPNVPPPAFEAAPGPVASALEAVSEPNVPPPAFEAAPVPVASALVSEPVLAPAASEPEPEPEPALPPAVLTLSLSGQRQVYWELPAQSLTPLRAHAPNGRPIVRVVTFRTRAGRVERHVSDLTPDSEVGSVVLLGLRADAVVRAVLGWEAQGRFMPYVVASDLPSGSPTSLGNGPFRANPLVGSVAPEVEQRALMHCSRRPAH